MVDLCTAALSRGHKVSVACTEHSVDGYGNYPEHIKSLNEQGIPLIFLNSTFSRDRGKNLQAVKTLEKEIVKNQPDIIHSHSSIPSYVAMNARSRQAKKTPIIQTMHGWGIYKTKEQETQDISIMEQVDHIVSISKSSEKLLIQKGLSNACRSIIFNGLAPNPVVENESSLNDEHILQIKRLKEKGIRIVGKPLGRPPKQQLSAYQKRKQKKEQNQRNLIEGKFGPGKNAYGLNNIQAKRRDTSESWIACIFFVMNLIKLEKIAQQYAIFCVLFKNSKQSGIFTNLLIDHANSYTKKVLNIDANPTFKLVTP